MLERREAQHAFCERSGREFACREQRGHSLMIEQAYRKVPRRDRLNPFLFQIELQNGDHLQQRPGQLIRRDRLI